MILISPVGNSLFYWNVRSDFDFVSITNNNDTYSLPREAMVIVYELVNDTES